MNNNKKNKKKKNSLHDNYKTKQQQNINKNKKIYQT